MRRVQKTEDVVTVVERIISKVQSKSEGNDFTFPYDLRAIIHTDRRTKRDTLLRENILILLSFCHHLFLATFNSTH